MAKSPRPRKESSPSHRHLTSDRPGAMHRVMSQATGDWYLWPLAMACVTEAVISELQSLTALYVASSCVLPLPTVEIGLFDHAPPSEAVDTVPVAQHVHSEEVSWAASRSQESRSWDFFGPSPLAEAC